MAGNDCNSEEEDNELYVIMMKKMSKYLKKTHPNQCNDNCGCHPDRKKQISEIDFVRINQIVKII